MKEKKVLVVVVYTHNVSRAIRVHELPKPGETVRSIGYSDGIDGAKGTNVAIALGRLGIPVALVANVRHGDWIEQGHSLLRQAGVDDSFITEYSDPTYSRGAMFIDDHGNNMIVLSSGRQVIPDSLIDQALDHFKDARYCVTGYELGEAGVRYTLLAAAKRGMKTIVNPSPVPDVLPDYWNTADIVILNEHELIRLLNDDAAVFDQEKTEQSLFRLREQCGCGAVVLTLGEHGFMLLEGERVVSEQGVKVNSVVDTSGAGDGFLAALTACLTIGMSLTEACRWANHYSSISIQRDGTISCYPQREEAEAVAGNLG